MEEKRQKRKKRLSLIDKELLFLEREKEMVSNAMAEVESDSEIKKRVKPACSPKEEKDPAPSRTLDQGAVLSFNQLFFEMKNLPLEYILSQSSKIVLTTEWVLSLLEKDWIEKIRIVKKLLDKKTFLEEKNKTEFTEIETKRREILRHAAEMKEKGRVLGRAIRRECTEESLFEKICGEESTAKKENDLERKYKELLSLFSLMKANKSAVRFHIPQTKKSSTSMHSSHSACLEKLRAEVGKITSIPELARYRQCKKQLGDTSTEHKIALEIPPKKRHCGPPKDPEEFAKTPGERTDDLSARRASALGETEKHGG